MPSATYFTHPNHDWQKRYEALRALYVDRLPQAVVADRFGYKPGYVRVLKYQFLHGKIDFSEPVPEGKASRRGITSDIRAKIRTGRERNLSAGDISEWLSGDGVELSVRTIERILAEEGFKKLPRRVHRKLGITVYGAKIPETSSIIDLGDLDGKTFCSAAAGLFLFAPFLEQLDLAALIHDSDFPGSKVIPSTNYALSFLALKLLGNERFAHVGDHSFDPGLGLFAGLNVLPKCTAMSTYSYSLDAKHLHKFQEAFVRKGEGLKLYDGRIINLDFHTAPHYGDESVLEKHWAGARGKVMKGALSLFAQDAESKLLLYSEADIKRSEADDEVLDFLSFWKRVHRGVNSTFVFDARLTTYENLSKLNDQDVHFITLRRRGKKLLKDAEKLTDWKRIHIPHEKRKYPNPEVHESHIRLRDYDGELRQIILRGNGREEPAFIISNDFDAASETIVGNYARRWRIENGIAEAVKFFHLNSLSSPILTKIHFDIVMTAVADTLYSMLAKKLRGFEECNATKIFRHFIRAKGNISVKGNRIHVSFPRHAHNPILRSVPWNLLPDRHPGMNAAKLTFSFE